MEREDSLGAEARDLLTSMGYRTVELRLAGSEMGCPEEAPFAAIIVKAAAPTLQRVLLRQMAQGGRLVIPIGSQQEQELVKVTRIDDGYSISNLGSCRFVPLLGRGA